jgi:hypothetical protein
MTRKKSQLKTKRIIPTWVKTLVIVLLLAIIGTLWADLSGIIILRKTEDMAGSENAISILWVGNSDIFVGELPRQLQTVARVYDVEIIYKDLSRHGNRGGSLSGLKESAIDEIQRGKYDYIILLDNPWPPMDDIDEFLSDIQFYCTEARDHDTIPVLFNATWAIINGQPDESRLSITTEAYKRAADENDVILVNAADAWIYAYKKIPEISLVTKFDPRGPHPSRAGGFLTACVFAAELFNLHIEEIPKDSRYKGNDASNLAEAAWEFVQSSQ